MPKLKTHKGLKWRIKVTGTGQLLHRKAGRRHLLTGKPSHKTRRLRKTIGVAQVQDAMVRRLLPYTS